MDVSVEAGSLTVSCFLHFDHLCISVIVSVSCKEALMRDESHLVCEDNCKY